MRRCGSGSARWFAAGVVALALAGGAAGARAGVGADGSWSLLPGLIVARQDHAAVYDAEGDRMIVFGGKLLANAEQGTAFESVGPSQDVGEITFAGTPAWHTLQPTGERPAARSSHTLILDRAERAAILFGGAGPQGFFGDVWRLDLAGTPSWTRLTPAGPAPVPRWGHTAIYDAAGDRMIVFGGFDANATPLGDVWALDLSGTPQWTLLTPTGPGASPRGNHVAVYDSRARRMIVMGGYDSFGRNDVWSLSLGAASAWTQIFPEGIRPAQTGEHAAVFDSVRNQVVFVGRLSNLAPNPPVFRLGLGGTPTWSSVPASGSIPSTFERQVLIADPVRDRIVMFGGGESIWMQSLAGSAWTSTILANALPSRRHIADTPVAIMDAKRNRVLLAFTNRFTEPLEFWSLDLEPEPHWSQLTTTGPVPSQREQASLVIDTRRDLLIMYGGVNTASASLSSQVWTLNLVTRQWSVASPPGPVGRFAHSAVYDSLADRMVVFGGWTVGAGASYVNQLWSYAPQSGSWSALSASGNVPARVRHAAIMVPSRQEMVVYGGVGIDEVAMDDVWTLSLGPAPAWSPVSTYGITPQHRDHQLAYDSLRDRMLAYGQEGAEPLQFGAVYALSFSPVPAWRRLLSAGERPHPGLVAAVYDPAGDRVVAAGRTSYLLDFGGNPAPSLAELNRDVRADRVELTFRAGHAEGMSAVLWRRTSPDEDWTEVATAPIDGDLVTIVDPAPLPGMVSTYRPGLRDQGGEQPFDPLRVEVPGFDRAGIARVWPNPAGRLLHARLIVPFEGDVRVEVIDLHGRQALRQTWHAGPGLVERTLDVPGSLAPGVYFIRVSMDRWSDARRITILDGAVPAL